MNMLHMWDAVEADFLRDYGIYLVERLDKISWRLFLSLLNNLSPYGAVASRIMAEQDKVEKQLADPDVYADHARSNELLTRFEVCRRESDDLMEAMATLEEKIAAVRAEYGMDDDAEGEEK